MKKRLLSLLCLTALTTTSLIGCGSKVDFESAMNEGEETYVFTDTETYKNHIEIEGQWGAGPYTAEGEECGVGDPFVMRFDGKYYMYPSGSHDETNDERSK